MSQTDDKFLDTIDENDLVPVVEQNSQIESLVNDFARERTSLNEMITDLEKIKSKIETLFPETMDKRYVRFFEEKMKAMTSLFGTILDIKKEIMKGIKTEVDLRKALSSKDNDDNMDDFDIREMAMKMDKLQNDMDKQKNKRKKLRTKGVAHVRIND